MVLKKIDDWRSVHEYPTAGAYRYPSSPTAAAFVPDRGAGAYRYPSSPTRGGFRNVFHDITVTAARRTAQRLQLGRLCTFEMRQGYDCRTRNAALRDYCDDAITLGTVEQFWKSLASFLSAFVLHSGTKPYSSYSLAPFGKPAKLRPISAMATVLGKSIQMDPSAITTASCRGEAMPRPPLVVAPQAFSGSALAERLNWLVQYGTVFTCIVSSFGITLWHSQLQGRV